MYNVPFQGFLDFLWIIGILLVVQVHMFVSDSPNTIHVYAGTPGSDDDFFTKSYISNMLELCEDRVKTWGHRHMFGFKVQFAKWTDALSKWKTQADSKEDPLYHCGHKDVLDMIRRALCISTRNGTILSLHLGILCIIYIFLSTLCIFGVCSNLRWTVKKCWLPYVTCMIDGLSMKYQHFVLNPEVYVCGNCVWNVQAWLKLQ